MKFFQTEIKLILASQSKVRKQILEKNNIKCIVIKSNLDEEPIKDGLIKDGASPEIISKNLAEIKAIKVSRQNHDFIVLGADSVIDLDNKIISKPQNRKEALEILKKLNGKKHSLISSVTLARNGSMIWNYTDKSELKMKNLSENELKQYLSKIKTETLLAYGVYQIEADGLNLFEYVKGDKDSIMGLPIKQIKDYISNYKI